MIKIFRAIKIGFQYMFRNFGLSFASVVVMTLSFFIVSVIALVFYTSFLLVRYIDSRPALVIFLKGDLSEEEASKFVDLVNSTALVREISLKDIDYSRKDFLNKYRDPELENLLVGKDKQEVQTFMPRIAFIYGNSQTDLEKLINILESDSYFMNSLVDKYNIDRIGWYSFNKDQANIIYELNQLILWLGLSFTLILLFISGVLIFITIRLSINYHRKEIEIMYLVGADGWFIKLPFVISGIIYGILGAFFSTTLLVLLKSFLFENSNSLVPRLVNFFSGVPWPDLDINLTLIIYLTTIGIGAFIGAASSFFAIVRYVKK